MKFTMVALCIVILTSCEQKTVKVESNNNNHSKKEKRIDSKPPILDNVPANDSIIELIQESPNDIEFDLPKGYRLFEEMKGDLNGDNLDDYVLIIKETDKNNVVINRFDKEVDRNRRGVIIYLTADDTMFLASENLTCFESENEDGGVYFPPELSVEIKNNKLYFHYSHGRYGFWKYTFRYQNSDFELIGYDHSENYGPIVNRETSINFLTKKKFTKENVNQNTEDSGDEVFQESWENIEIKELYQLSEISDFYELDVSM